MLPGDRPIFIVGCPRSGTTLLQLMLHAHPRIAIPPETRFTLRAYDLRRTFGDLMDPINRRRLGKFITGPGTLFGDLGLNANQVVDDIMSGPPTLGSAISIVFRAYSAKFGKERWGDKRPAYLLNLDILLWLFPDAQIIHIIRDGRDCVASMKEQPWHSGGVNHAISRWHRGMEAGRRAAKRLAADQYLEVCYEDLVAVPESQITKVCDFVGEQYDPAMLEPSHLATIAVPERKKWHSRTHEPVTTERVGSWQQRLTPGEIALCEAVFGRQLTDRGYELSGIGSVSLAERARYTRHGVADAYKRSHRTIKVSLDRIRGAQGLAAHPNITTAREDADA